MGNDFSQNGCYGNWSLSFTWQDFLRGKIEYTEINNVEKYEEFYLSLYFGT